jgi:glycosyltransferase involved in cell wall biosynthesis/peptidoglycan/xylan/chitin deacetylase (PgdA/CDA1 family)
MKNVLIIEAQIKQYRKPFYERLHRALRKEGVQLRVVYSVPSTSEARKHDNCDLPGEYGVRVKGYWMWKERLLFQVALREIASAELIIVDQANKLLLNHLLLPLSLCKLKKVAFWGLGENLQADRSTFSEWYKERTLNWVHWWFGYTEGTARYLSQHGVPSAKITAVQNSVDTRRIQACVRHLSLNAKAALRAKLGIGPSMPVGIFVGMLHKVKSVPFLIEAGEKIRQTISEFQLIVVGGGPDEEGIKQSARERPWVHFVGPRFGHRKSQLLAIADVFLLPGRAGLAVLDAFAAGLPLVVTRLPIHGPEMEYFEEGRNGVMTPHDPEPYADAVAHIFTHRDELAALREGARGSAEKYSIETMADNFTQGILQCLSHPKERLRLARAAEMKSPQVVAPRESRGQPPRWHTGNLRKKPETQEQAVLSPGTQLNPAQHRSLITTSWDDGHPLDLRVAELLAKSGLAGTFYVPRTSQRPVMSGAQIRELSKFFEIGAHTLDHVAIDRLSDAQASAQLSGSREWVQELTGKSCRVFCFPGGKFRSRQLPLVRQSGYEAVRTVELLSIGGPRRVDGLCVIPTTIQVFPHGPYAYAKNALKRLSAPVMNWPRGSLLSRDWLTLAKHLFLTTMQRGGVFHLWGHSWEIEEQAQWENLEKFLMTVGKWRQQLTGVTNSELSAYAV